MRRIPVLDVVREAYSLSLANGTLLVGKGLRTYIVALCLSMGSALAGKLDINLWRYEALPFVLVHIPYLACCYLFVVDGKHCTTPFGTGFTVVDRDNAARYKRFTFYILLQGALSTATLVGGFALLFSGGISPLHHVGGLLLTGLGIIVWLALAFTLPAAATGRPTTAAASAILVGCNILPLFTVLFMVCAPHAALAAAAYCLWACVPAPMEPALAAFLLAPVGSLWFLSFSTTVAVAIGASYREIAYATARRPAAPHTQGTCYAPSAVHSRNSR